MAGASGAVRAGGAFVEIFAKDGALRKSLDAAEARVRAFGGKMAKVGAAIAGAGAVVAGPLAIAKKFAIDDGAAIDGLAKSLNTTAEDITAFGFAALKAGVPFEDLGGFLGGLNSKLTGLADGTDASADRLREFGIYGRNLINLPFPEQMEKLAQAVRETINPIDRASIATEFFGDAGKAMLPVLEEGAAGMRKYMNEAKATGQVMTGEQAAKAAAAQRALNSAWESARKAVAEVGMAMIPSVEVIARFSAQFQAGAAAVRDFVRENAAVIAIVGSVATGVVALGTALSVVGGILAGVATAFGTVATIVGAILSPLGLVVVILAALVVAFVEFTDAGAAACATVGEAFDGLAETFGAAWSAIVGAVKAGDLTAAFGVVTSLLSVMLNRGIVKMLGAWNDFKGSFVDSWNDGMMIVELCMEAASTAIAQTMVDMLAFIAKNFSDTFNAIVEGAAQVAEALNATETAATIRGAKDLVKLDTDGMKKMIEEDHKAASNKIVKDRDKQQDASDASRANDMKGAKNDLANAEKAFADALGVAVQAAESDEREKRGNREKAGDWELSVGDGKKQQPDFVLPTLSRGSFSGENAGQAFGAAGIQSRQLRAAEETNEILKEVVKAVEGSDKKAAVFK